jgi:hypothetical protein
MKQNVQWKETFFTKNLAEIMCVTVYTAYNTKNIDSAVLFIAILCCCLQLRSAMEGT